MSDIVDTANRNTEVQLARQIAAQRNCKVEPALVIDGTRYCIDCEEAINPERIEKQPNAVRCIDCQTAKEKKDKHFA